MRTRSTLLVTAAALALGGSAAAQTRDGFFIGVGTSWTWGQASGDGIPGAKGHDNWLFPIRLGGKISARMLLGAEIGHWGSITNDTATSNVIVDDYVVAAYYYPAKKGGFLKGGLGLSSVHTSGFDQPIASGNGLGAMLGAGYDFPIGTRVAITPIATFRFGSPGTLHPDDGGSESVRGFKRNVVELSVGFSFY